MPMGIKQNNLGTSYKNLKKTNKNLIKTVILCTNVYCNQKVK